MKIDSIEIAIQTRRNFVQLMKGMTIEELNSIPVGFNNNILWNFGHIVVSQQKLCYTLAGATPRIAAEYITSYQKGSKPMSFIEREELLYLEEQAFSLLTDLYEDLETGLFKSFTTTRLHYGLELKSVTDAVNYFPNHDALHLGFATALKKAVEIQKNAVLQHSMN